MESSTLTVVDLEMGSGDVYQATVNSGEKSRNWPWKTVGAVFFVAFCVAASGLFAWNFTRNDAQRKPITAFQNSSTTEHHPHMLTQPDDKTKAAIHLSVSGQNDNSERLHWTSNVDQSFSTGDLNLENDEIIIPSEGLYFVYSQASFDVQCKLDDSRDILSYTIQWRSPAISSSSKKDLLNAVKSICQPNSEEEQENQDSVQEVIYLGAVFWLYKGDKLSTHASHLSYILPESSQTFFGVFQL